MKITYSFSVLRYMHDPATQEFANIGVALYSKEARYLNAVCTTNYGRISKMFTKIDGNRFRQVTRYIETQVRKLGDGLPSQLSFEPPAAIQSLLARILPPDDSAFQFSPAGAGITSNPEKTLTELFERFVERYSLTSDSVRRDEEDVWKVFRGPLERRHVAARLVPKKIVAPNYDYEFQHSWKNQVWHVCEPVSFDMVDASSILDKANRWVGRAMSLVEGNENFKMHVLLGEPRDSKLQSTFVKAQNILHKIPNRPELVSEREAESFADEVAQQIAAHPQE